MDGVEYRWSGATSTRAGAPPVHSGASTRSSRRGNFGRSDWPRALGEQATKLFPFDRLPEDPQAVERELRVITNQIKTDRERGGVSCRGDSRSCDWTERAGSTRERQKERRGFVLGVPQGESLSLFVGSVHGSGIRLDPGTLSFDEVLEQRAELTCSTFLVQATGDCCGVDFCFWAKHGEWEFEAVDEHGQPFPIGDPRRFVRREHYDENEPGAPGLEWAARVLRSCLSEWWS